jgi:hypothetical protein
LLLGQPNTILLEDGVVRAEGALRYAEGDAGVTDHNIVRHGPLLQTDRDVGVGVAAAGFTVPPPIVVVMPSIGT